MEKVVLEARLHKKVVLEVCLIEKVVLAVPFASLKWCLYVFVYCFYVADMVFVVFVYCFCVPEVVFL